MPSDRRSSIRYVVLDGIDIEAHLRPRDGRDGLDCMVAIACRRRRDQADPRHLRGCQREGGPGLVDWFLRRHSSTARLRGVRIIDHRRTPAGGLVESVAEYLPGRPVQRWSCISTATPAACPGGEGPRGSGMPGDPAQVRLRRDQGLGGRRRAPPPADGRCCGPRRRARRRDPDLLRLPGLPLIRSAQQPA